MITRILLTRHGHVDGIDPPKFRGRIDLPLTPLGRAQAKAVAARIATGWRPDAVYTSPLGRCVDVGAEIAAACGVGAEVLEGLVDLDYGDWQGRSHDEVEAHSPELFARWFAAPERVRFPGGDSLQDLAARIADGFRRVLAAHAGGTVVLVGHDSVNRAFLTQLMGLPLSAYWRIAQSPCCLNEIEAGPESAKIVRLNETAHTEGLD